MKKVYVILAIAALVLCTSCGNNKKKAAEGECACTECTECKGDCKDCKDCECKNAEEAVKEAAEAVENAAEAVEEAVEKAAE